MLQGRRSWVRVPMRWILFLIYLILPASLWPRVDSASNRNEYQKFSWGVKGGRRVRLNLQPSVSRLSRENVEASTSHNHMGLHGLSKDSFTFTVIIKGHYITSRKVDGSVPNEVTGFFNWPNPSSHTMALALGSTQPLTEMSTKNLPGRQG
jgi:hypothetical protein